MWLLMDIGCLHCGAKSSIIGVYDKREEADAVADHWRKHAEWNGEQHEYQVFLLRAPE